jgi:hypothetical protein
MADFFTMIGDMIGLNKGRGTIDAANRNQGLIDQYATNAGSTLQGGLGRAGGFLTEAEGLTDLGPNANSIYRSAITGDDGGVAARGAFQSSPGYRYALDQGEQAILRNRAATGSLSSGGTDIDLMRHGVGLADQDFDQWLSRLTGGIDRNRSALGDLATFTQGGTGMELDLMGDVTGSNLAVNNQIAAGEEAGQGRLLDLIGTIVGVGGKAMGGGFGGFGGGVGGVGGGLKVPMFGYGR